MSQHHLTGQTRFRSDRKGRLILQVEYKYNHTSCTGGYVDVQELTDWRDAKITDVTKMKDMSYISKTLNTMRAEQ